MTRASFDDWKKPESSSVSEWKKDTNSYITLHDKVIHPGYIFKEVKEGRLHENKSLDLLSNTYHHSWTKDRYRRKQNARPASAKVNDNKTYAKVKMIRPRSAHLGDTRI